MIRDHLKFVLDNYHLLNVAFSDIKNVKYIITAINADEEGDEDPVLESIRSGCDSL